MVRKKSGSKRQSMKTRYNITKRAKSQARKLKKLAKANPHYRPKGKKDPGIPNLWPLKDQMIKKVEEMREKDKELREEKKNARAKAVERKRKANVARALEQSNPDNEFNSQVNQAQFGVKNYESEVAKRRWYFKEMKNVIDAADVILEVLDARDPMGCRSKEIEAMVQGQISSDGQTPKRIILVLNKIDLVPPEVVEKWVSYLKREFPTLAFKASTQKNGKGKIGHSNKKVDSAGLDKLSGCVGGSALLQLLKNYARLKKTRRSKAINVGIIGYPNVGKSSLINSLKRSKVAGVGSTPGFTKAVQTIKLDSSIMLLDSPGVLMSAGSNDEALVLRNCLRVEQMEDPVGAVEAIVKRCTMEQLCLIYKIAAFDSALKFLSHVAHKRGKLGKGGVPNLKLAARSVLKDWNEGVIPFYSLPPQVNDIQTSELVTEFAKEFDIDSLFGESNSNAMETMQSEQKELGDKLYMHIESSATSGPSSMSTSASSMSMSMSMSSSMSTSMTDDSQMLASYENQTARGAKKKLGPQRPGVKTISAADENNFQINRGMKKDKKKAKKEARRAARAASSNMDDGDDYNFETDWTE